MITCKSNRWEYEVLWYIQETDHNDIKTYHERSKQAFINRSWLSVAERINHLQWFLDEYKIIWKEIALSISKEIGKPITQSLADIEYDIGYIQWHLDNAMQILAPEVIYETENSLHTAYYEPKWVATVISPRNYPTSQWVRQVIPPLLAGNTILYKSASACMRTGKIMSDLVIKHLPEWVLIPFYGDSSLWQALIDLPTDLTIFTGSTWVGTIISTTNGSQMETSHLELWWSAPGIICEDAIIDNQMMQTIDYFRVQHGGQICDGLKRLIVHESKLDEFIQTISHYFQDLKVWNPLDPETGLWPLINHKALEIINKQIQDSIQWKSIQTLTLWNYDTTPWGYMKLTLLIGNELIWTPVMRQEIFGPVLPVVTFKTIDEAITIANNTMYGLWGYLWTKNNQIIDYICSKLKTGNINVNNTNYVIPQVPFGGYTQASGNFREHWWVGLRGYCEMKMLSRNR
jgi:succinate-semialdehyde dehydrogenase/glutarate-semialdehyde dehydrogenase